MASRSSGAGSAAGAMEEGTARLEARAESAARAPEISNATRRAGAASTKAAGRNQRESSRGADSDHASINAEAGVDTTAKNRAAGRPSPCQARASRPGRSRPKGLDAPPAAHAAASRSARSVTSASGESRGPNARPTAGRVCARSARTAPLESRARVFGGPEPRAMAAREKRRKSPEAATREDAPGAPVKPGLSSSRPCPGVGAADAQVAVGQRQAVQRAQLEGPSLGPAALDDLRGPACGHL